jgi:hypothetical protein
VVDVDDLGLGGGALGDVVGVVGGGQAGADVEELADAVFGRQLVHRVDQEQARGPSDQRHGRHRLEDPFGQLAVGGEVILAAQPVVPHAGRVRHAGIERRQLAAIGPGRWRALRHLSPFLPARSVIGESLTGEYV